MKNKYHIEQMHYQVTPNSTDLYYENSPLNGSDWKEVWKKIPKSVGSKIFVEGFLAGLENLNFSGYKYRIVKE